MVRKNHRRASSHLVRRGVGTFPTPAANYCDTCLPAYQLEQFEQRFSGSGLAKLEALKADGRDPTHGQEAAVKRGAANARRKAEIRNWEQQYGKLTDLSAFEREILPLIQNVPLSRLAKTTGLSLRYVSQISRGERTPHPRHWSKLRNVVPERPKKFGLEPPRFEDHHRRPSPVGRGFQRAPGFPGAR